jgi:hypothetical protein
VTIAALLASGVVGGTSLALWYFGSRYARRYVAINGVMPPLTWMFRRATDRDLEMYRRRALAFLPFYLVAVVILIIQP